LYPELAAVKSPVALIVRGTVRVHCSQQEWNAAILAAINYPLGGGIGVTRCVLLSLERVCRTSQHLQTILVGESHDWLAISHRLTLGKTVVQEMFMREPSETDSMDDPEGHMKVPLSEAMNGVGDSRA